MKFLSAFLKLQRVLGRQLPELDFLTKNKVRQQTPAAGKLREKGNILSFEINGGHC